MRDIPFIPITDDSLYQGIANTTGQASRSLLHQMHAHTAHQHGTTDAGPLLSGFILGAIFFVSDTGGDWDEVQAAMFKQAGVLWPQVKMDRDADDAGAAGRSGEA